LSSCCYYGVIYGTEIDFDESGAFGVCSSCHDYVPFYDEGHSPWDDDVSTKSFTPVINHNYD